MSFALRVCFSTLFFLMLIFGFLILILVAFLLGTISCFMSKLSTVPTMSLECFLGLFLIGWTCKEGIVVLLFIPALGILHCLVFILQNLLHFWESHISISELIFYNKYSSLILRLWWGAQSVCYECLIIHSMPSVHQFSVFLIHETQPVHQFLPCILYLVI